MIELSQQNKQEYMGIAAMFGAASIWGTWVLMLAYISIPSIYILPITFTSSALALSTFVLTSSRRNAFFVIFKNRAFMRLLAWVVLLEITQTSLYFVSYTMAIRDGASVVIPIIRSLAGIITPVLAVFSTNEKFRQSYLFYGLLSSVGAVLIFSRGGVEAGENISYLALILVTISVLLRGWFYLEQRKVAQELQVYDYNPVHVMAVQFILSSLFLLIFASIYINISPLPLIENLTRQIALLAVFGITHTGFGSLLRLLAMRQITAQQSIIIMYVEPVLAVTLSIIFLGETITIGFLIGAVMILFAAGAASLQSKK